MRFYRFTLGLTYTVVMDIWDQHFAARSLMFEPLRPLGTGLSDGTWPTPEQLTAMARNAAIVSGGRQPVRFEAVTTGAAPAAADYEWRCYTEGVVALREGCWHDFFNAAAWVTFPHIKAALNRAHIDALRVQAARQRSRKRDAMTLFDESGVLVLSSNRAVLEGIRSFDWQRVFWQERDTLANTTRFVMVGHALYEKALSPYVGMTGHALLLEMPDTGAWRDGAAWIAQADARAAKALAGIAEPGDLSPLPVLGVPGWWEANRDAAFYANTAYFRAGRTRGPAITRDAPA